MSHHLPRLIELPPSVPETEIPERLTVVLGDDAAGLDRGARQWLTIARLHRSGLYESRELSSAVSPTCLALLENVGSTLLELERRAAIGRKAPEWNVHRLNDEQARFSAATRSALVGTLGVSGYAELGAGERLELARRDGQHQGSRTLEVVALQVLGWWSLVLPGRRIRPLVQELHASVATHSVGGLDWRMPFERRFGHLGPEFTFTETGPDHLRRYEARVRTRDGREGAASATRKKEAAQLACHAYLAAYAPDLLARGGTARKEGSRLPARLLRHPVPEQHRRLARDFGCRDIQRISQAVTHGSWVYENLPGCDVKRDGNAVLALLGSAVLAACFARTRAATLLSEGTNPDPAVASALGLSRTELRPLGEALRIAEAARFGAGARKDGVSAEMIADLVQAVLAATFLESSDQRDFEQRLPATVSQFLVEHAGRSLRDPSTLLQELASELQLNVDGQDRWFGQDHCRVYENTTRISANGTSVEVQAAGPSRREARKAAAAPVVDADRLRTGETPRQARDDIAWFLVERQLGILAHSRSRWPRWRRGNVLGVGMLGDRERFASWTREVVRRTPASQAPPPAVLAKLAEYYADAVRAEGSRPLFAAALHQVLEWVLGAFGNDERGALNDEPWRLLVAVTAAQSVWLQPYGEGNLADVVRDWETLNCKRQDIHIEASVDAPTDARGCAAVLRLLQECVASGTASSAPLVVRLSRLTDHHEIRLKSDRQRRPDTAMAELVAEAAPSVVAERVDDGLVVRVRALTESPDWLHVAAAQASDPDEYDAEVGRLLHDLKNEITAARVTLTVERASRTERLETQLAASRHLDAAEAVAARLAQAEMPYSAGEAGECELSTFLRSYVRDTMTNVPPTIRVVPSAATLARVDVSERFLRSALDNLVKNAVEAMPNGGQITFDHTPMLEDGVVLLECRDTGPGVPAHVVASVLAGVPTVSSKRHGSGLGLPGVQRGLHRAGGSLEPLETGSGGGWLLVLPMTQPEPVGANRA